MKTAFVYGCFALYVTGLVSSQTVDNFVIITSAGNDAVLLSIDLIWDSVSYSCDFTPSSATNNALTCDNTIWSSITPAQPDQPFYVRVEWDSPNVLLDISSINVTLLNGDWFLFDEFCIHSKMVCTVSSDLTSTGACAQWPSKDAYTSMVMGSTSKFSLLYFDIRGDIADVPNFANTMQEMSVRPPNLVSMSFFESAVSETPPTPLFLTAAVQWDNKLYQCTDIPAEPKGTTKTCDLTDAGVASNVQCPGKEADYWWSLFTPDENEYIGFNNATLTDETGTSYTFSVLCQLLAVGFFYPNEPPYCSVINSNAEYIKVGADRTQSSNQFDQAIFVGGLSGFIPPLAVLKAPALPQQQCIFAFPNEITTAEIEVENLAAANLGWDVDQFGGPDAPLCLNTSSPTAYPTAYPTAHPTLEPTLPTHNPTVSPTIEPTVEPTIPTSQPTEQPTKQPSPDPTITPTAQPSSIPTLSPSTEPTMSPTHATDSPTFDPTTNPSEMPSSNPSNQPSAMPTEQPTTSEPTNMPTNQPTVVPTTAQPSMQPTKGPSADPTTVPTAQPSMQPTFEPTTKQPTASPSMTPSFEPTAEPSLEPTFEPTLEPTMEPSADPTKKPTDENSLQDEEESDGDDDVNVVGIIIVGALGACLLLLLLLLLLVLLMKRRKEGKETEQQTEFVVVTGSSHAEAGIIEMETQQAIAAMEELNTFLPQ